MTIVFTFCAPAAFATEAPVDTTEPSTFHAPTIREMIELNLELGSSDEQFFHVLANAYLADPALLVETIQDLTADEIIYLAKAIAYDLQQTGRTDMAVISPDCDTPQGSAIARMIYGQVTDPQNAELDVFYDDAFLNSDSIMADLYAPSVSRPTLSTSSAEINTTVTATFAISVSQAIIGGIDYLYTVYRVNEDTGAETIVKIGQATIPDGARRVTTSCSFSNSYSEGIVTVTENGQTDL